MLIAASLFNTHAQTLVEEAYEQRLIDAFHNRENCLSTVLPSLSTNFSFRVRHELPDDVELGSACQIYVGASRGKSYIAMCDKSGMPYCLMKEDMFLVYNQKSPEQYSAFFKGNHRFRFGILENGDLQFVLQFDGEGNIPNSEVTFNLAMAFYNSLKIAKKMTMVKQTETLVLEMPKERVISIVFGPGSEKKPVKLNELHLKSPRASIIFDTFEFEIPRNDNVVSISRKDLGEAGFNYKEVGVEELKLSLHAPVDADWKKGAGGNPGRLKKLLQIK
jgi:hypothetical protein